MAKVCPITKKKIAFGNNVSHANNKTRRTFKINMQHASFMSEALNRCIQLRLTTRGMKTIEFHGGLDAFVKRTALSKLPAELKTLKRILSLKK